MLWYLMLTQEQADALNAILVPVYCTPPTIYYVPQNGGLFPYVDGSQFADSIYDPQIPEIDQEYILEVMQGRKDYDEAVAAGWIVPPNDG